MPSDKDLKKRIASVKNTQQTTRAMKMVSAAKLRRAQDAIQNQRPYARKIGELMKRVSSLSESGTSSPLIRRDREGGAGGRKVLLVVVTSDRGLCGGFNGNIIKATQRWVSANASAYEKITLSFVGKKGYDFFKTKKFNVGTYFQEAGGKVTFAKARKVADLLVQSYLNEEVDEVKLVYNEFKNAVSQKVVVEDFLPLQPSAGANGSDAAAAEPAETPGVYLVKPSIDAVVGELLEKNFAIQAFRILLESQASEHGARMSAMENATKNAGEMIRKLTLQYNKQRQAGITKQLLEIISGSESLKSSA